MKVYLFIAFCFVFFSAAILAVETWQHKIRIKEIRNSGKKTEAVFTRINERLNRIMKGQIMEWPEGYGTGQVDEVDKLKTNLFKEFIDSLDGKNTGLYSPQIAFMAGFNAGRRLGNLEVLDSTFNIKDAVAVPQGFWEDIERLVGGVNKKPQ
jgi:hypothetical protein